MGEIADDDEFSAAERESATITGAGLRPVRLLEPRFPLCGNVPFCQHADRRMSMPDSTFPKWRRSGAHNENVRRRDATK